MKRFLPALYILSLVVVSCLSYAFVDPNLTLINQPWFYALQKSLWQLASDSQMLSVAYWSVTLLVVFAYAGFLWAIKKGKLSKYTLLLLLIGAVVLTLGHNAYSHDIFNYLFNAKMVVEYGGNPHQQVALDFPNDLWLRFMHNVHTPAPYGYGWTALSLAPYLLGFDRFLSAYFSMKLFMVLGYGLFLHFSWKLLHLLRRKDKEVQWLVVAFHPLLLIETLMNGHNDIWMMWPAIAAWYFLKGKRSVVQSLFVAALMLLSISIKFVTILLVPLMLLEFLPAGRQRVIIWAQKHWAELSALLMMAPLITDRSQQFHPWYLIWSLVFLPFIDWKWLRYGILGLSVSSLFRYLPWIAAGFQYTDQVQLELRFITWSGLAVGLFYWLFETQKTKRPHS